MTSSSDASSPPTQSEVTVNTREGVASAETTTWTDPEITPAPLGVLVNILTLGGIQIKAPWKEDAGFIAWAPMLKIPAWARDRINQRYKGKPDAPA